MKQFLINMLTNIFNVTEDSETTSKQLDATSNASSSTSNFVSGNNDLEDFGNRLLGYIMDSLRSVLQPVEVSYSNEVLANQINDISIILFIMSILITGLIIALIFNVIVLVNSEKILSYFKNKYIRMYISFNKKLLNIEVIVLGSTIVYYMYNLSMGIRFIATHPIIFS